MTRHRARSTFTFEVKRAAKRTPEVVTLQRTPASAGSSLADQVFGRFSPSPPAPRAGAAEPKAVDAAASAPAPAPQGDVPQPRRVLPDLLTVPANPVEERIAQAAEERMTRRRSAEPRSAQPRKPRKPRETRPAAQPEPAGVQFSFLDALPDDDEIRAPAVRPEPAAFLVATDGAEASTRPKRSTRAGRQSLKAVAIRAERKGGEPPRLPAGQRWKRRLPKACW